MCTRPSQMNKYPAISAPKMIYYREKKKSSKVAGNLYKSTGFPD